MLWPRLPSSMLGSRGAGFTLVEALGKGMRFVGSLTLFRFRVLSRPAQLFLAPRPVWGPRCGHLGSYRVSARYAWVGEKGAQVDAARKRDSMSVSEAHASCIRRKETISELGRTICMAVLAWVSARPR